MKKASKIIILLFAISIFYIWQNTKVNAVENTTEKLFTITIDNYFEYKPKEKIYKITDEEEDLKQKILKAIKNKEDFVSVTEYSSDLTDDYNKILGLYLKVLDENPKLFYASCNTLSGYGYHSEKENKSILTHIKITYLDVDQTQLEDMTAKLNNKISKISRNLRLKSPNLSLLEKEYAIYDYIQQNCVYNHKKANSSINPDGNYDNFGLWHNAYGGLVEGTPVCDGYAKSIVLLLQEAGVKDCGLIYSNNHAWNYINCEGNYYMLDATFDDEENHNPHYDYFNIDQSLKNVNDHSPRNNEYEDIMNKCTDNRFKKVHKLSNWYNAVRISNRLYYTLSGKVYSSDLYGEDEKLIYDGLNDNIIFYPRAGCKSMLYDYVQNDYGTYYIISLNIYDNKLYIIDEVKNRPEYMYKQGDNLVVQVPDADDYSKYYEYKYDISMKEDINNDGYYTASDIAEVAAKYNQKNDEMGSLNDYDLNDDGIVDIYDICKVSSAIQ